MVWQFLAESVVIALLSAILSICIAEMFLPGINLITQKQLVSPQFYVLASVFMFSTVIGVVAGLYPAFYLSSFEPVKVLKVSAFDVNTRFSLRKVLVVTQFTISLALIIGTLVVAQQIRFIQNAKLGLNKDHVVMINDYGYLSRSDRHSLKII
jgi:putative ABC transport system permease protein